MSALSRGRGRGGGGYPVGSLLTSAMQCLILHKYFRAISPIRSSWLAFFIFGHFVVNTFYPFIIVFKIR